MFPLEQGRNMELPGTSDPSGGADSGVFFGASVLIVIGVFQGLQGLAAILNAAHFEEAADYAFSMGVSTWGWIHLGFGVLLVIGGVNLFRGSKAAGLLAIVLAGLSAILNFLFIPHYPFWGIIIVLVDIWVIWAISASGILSD